MPVRPTKTKLVSAVRKRMGRDLSRDEAFRLARAMRARETQPRIYKPRMELWDDGESATITALFELPGLGPDEVLLDVVDGRLVVSGSRRQRAFNSNRTVGRAQGVAQPASGPLQVRELKYGTFRRVVPVPPGCVTCDLEATLEHGMLTVSWPRYPGALTPEQDSPSDLSSDLPDTPTDALEPAARFGGNDASDVPS